MIKAIGAVFILAAIIDVGYGIYSTNKWNANHTWRERHDLYDGPWLPIEFGLLGIGVIAFKGEESTDGSRE